MGRGRSPHRVDGNFNRLPVPAEEGDEGVNRIGEQLAQLVEHERRDRREQRRALAAPAAVAVLLGLRLLAEDLEDSREPAASRRERGSGKARGRLWGRGGGGG